MSVSDNITRWKQKADIDYISLFVPLWLACNAWIKDRYPDDTDRKSLEKLKLDDINNDTFTKFREYLLGGDSKSETFRDYLSQLSESLFAASLSYDKDYPNDILRVISLKNVIVDYNNGNPEFDNLIKEASQRNKIELVNGIYITDDINKVYRGYIEILYQIRCKLLHGNLTPIETNEKVIKYLYLTLLEIAINI